MSDIQPPTTTTKNKTQYGPLFIILILVTVLAAWSYLRFSDIKMPWQKLGGNNAELSLENVDQRLLETEKNVMRLESERGALQQR